MPRKTKAELAAEHEEQECESAENGELAVEQAAGEELDVTPVIPESEETPVGEADDKQQENAIAGLLASYSETADSSPEPDDQPEACSEDTASDGEGAELSSAAIEENITDQPTAAPNVSVEPDIARERDSGKATESDGLEEIQPAESAKSIESDRPAEISASAPRRPSFFQTNFRELDRGLSAEQMQEWNSIYASYRSKSILTGTVIGVDDNRFEVTNPQTGLAERRTVHSLVIVGYRVKVLIPESEVWAPGEERPDYVMRGMVGARVDYVVMQVDREGECAIASRRSALAKQRRHFMAVRGGHEPGETLSCNVLVVGPRRVLVECGGYDITLSQRDLSWTAISDLRQEYRPGQELPCKLTEYSAREGKLSISVRDVTPNPFIGAENRHPIGSRRQAVISGKYAGGVFCRLPDGVTVLCLYSNLLGDDEFLPGDGVLVHITQYDYRRQLIYGRIISKW